MPVCCQWADGQSKAMSSKVKIIQKHVACKATYKEYTNAAHMAKNNCMVNFED